MEDRRKGYLRLPTHDSPLSETRRKLEVPRSAHLKRKFDEQMDTRTRFREHRIYLENTKLCLIKCSKYKPIKLWHELKLNLLLIRLHHYIFLMFKSGVCDGSLGLLRQNWTPLFYWTLSRTRNSITQTFIELNVSYIPFCFSLFTVFLNSLTFLFILISIN